MNSDLNLQDLRVDYGREPLHEDNLNANPFEQFRLWFQEVAAANIAEPNAMTLGTSDPSGRVSCRTVLLKEFDERGFVFFTNYESRKARQILGNPKAALLFPWLILERQVEVFGKVEKISEEESSAYFFSRPRGSRLGAWVSNQSTRIPSREFLTNRYTELQNRFGEGPIPKPDFWGGFRVVPETIEFWQGGHDRLHDRFLYERCQGCWQISRLSP